MKLLKLSCAVASALLVTPALAQENDEVVIVTGTSSQVSIHQAPASVTVVTSEEINQIPAANITQALAKIAGVQISQGSGEPSIKMRGLSSNYSNYTLLLINGRRVNSNEAIMRGASFDISSIPLSAVDRVEVVRGPMSTLYGSEAIGGVVNVILKEPTDDFLVSGSVGFVSPETGDGELKNSSIFISGSIVPDSVLFHANVDVTDRDAWAVAAPQGKNSNIREAQERLSVDTSLTWLASDKDKVIFDLGLTVDDREVPNANTYESNRVSAGIGYQREWSWGLSSLNYYVEKSKVFENSVHPHPMLKGEMKGTQLNQNFDGKAVLDLDDHIVTTGFDFSHTAVNHDRFYTEGQSSHQSAVYVQDEFSITDPLTLTVSGRYTQNEKFGGHFSPRVYLSYQVNESLTFKGGYGEGFKAPDIWWSSDKLFVISCGGRCYLRGNPDLEPETSQSFEFTTVWNQPTWYVQSTVFHNEIRDMILRDTKTAVGMTPKGAPIISMINLDQVESKGIEIDGEVDISDSVFLTANATYTNSKDKTTNEKLAYTPNLMANVGLNWSVTDELTLFSDVKYTGDQVYTHTDRATRTSTVRDLKPYATINLGGSFQVNDTFKLKAGLSNVTDRRLYEEEYEYNHVDMGRSFYAAVDFEF